MIRSTNQSKQQLTRNRRYFLLPLVFLVIGSQSLKAADSNDEQEKTQERWFEVEVILYKPNQDISNESWNKETQLTMPENIKDFLQPYGLLEPTQTDELTLEIENGKLDAESNDSSPLENELDVLAESNLSSSNNSNSNNSILEEQSYEALSDALTVNGLENENEDETSLEDEFVPEEPFIALDSEDFRLTKEAQNIDKSHKYKLLAHFAWRQPVFDKQSAVPVRIAGGLDYQESFDYSGDKKIIIEEPSLDDSELLDSLPLEELGNDNNSNHIEGLPTEKVDDLVDQNGLSNSQKLSTPSSNSNDLDQTQQLSETSDVDIETGAGSLNVNSMTSDVSSETVSSETESGIQPEPTPVALPWVPEIDGSLIVFIYRNYLHVNTDMFYRLPGKEEVEQFGLGSLFENSNNDFNNLNSSLSDSNSNFESSLTPNLPQSDLVWHYDDNFLLEEPEKQYRERLFNYPLTQKRRMRSTELHYFDHPLIGMLVVITPYETQSQEIADDVEELQ